VQFADCSDSIYMVNVNGRVIPESFSHTPEEAAGPWTRDSFTS